MPRSHLSLLLCSLLALLALLAALAAFWWFGEADPQRDAKPRSGETARPEHAPAATQAGADAAGDERVERTAAAAGDVAPPPTPRDEGVRLHGTITVADARN